MGIFHRGEFVPGTGTAQRRHVLRMRTARDAITCQRSWLGRGRGVGTGGNGDMQMLWRTGEEGKPVTESRTQNRGRGASLKRGTVLRIERLDKESPRKRV